MCVFAINSAAEHRNISNGALKMNKKCTPLNIFNEAHNSESLCFYRNKSRFVIQRLLVPIIFEKIRELVKYIYEYTPSGFQKHDPPHE